MLKKRKLAVLLYLRRKYRQNKVAKRKYWVRPTITLTQRKSHSCYFTLNQEQREQEPRSFFSFYRMNAIQFDILLAKVRSKINKIYWIREPISPAERLAITLRWVVKSNYEKYMKATKY